MTKKLLRGPRLVVIIGLLLTVSLAFTAAPASASTHSSAAASHHATGHVAGPESAQGCTSDVCIYLSTPSGGYVSVKGWPYDVGFYGYFRLTGPDGLSKDSPTASYTAGGAGYTFTKIEAVVGKYCITGFSGTINEGEPCESVE